MGLRLGLSESPKHNHRSWRLLAANTDMKAVMGDYLEKLGQPCPESAYKGHFIPFGDFRKTPGQGAVLLAGDAAGLVDPITGEGIAFAMKSGQLAALAAAQSLAAGQPENAFAIYRKALKPLHRSLHWANRLRPPALPSAPRKPLPDCLPELAKHETRLYGASGRRA